MIDPLSPHFTRSGVVIGIYSITLMYETTFKNKIKRQIKESKVLLKWERKKDADTHNKRGRSGLEDYSD